MKGASFGTLNNFQKKSNTENGGAAYYRKERGTPLLRNACKKISAYAPVRTRASKKKASILLDHERLNCDLPAETKVVPRKKAPALSHNTCLSPVLERSTPS